LNYNNIPIEELNDIGIIKNVEKEKCFVCDTETEWFDMYFQVPSCSQRCSRQISKEIFREVKRLSEIVTRLEERIDKFMR
jgi:hypothetical protein